MKLLSSEERRILLSLALPSLLCLGLLVLRRLITHDWNYSFVLENLILAWLALVFAWMLTRSLKTRGWLSPSNIILSLLWLAFLPNAWYVITDFVHAVPSGEISQLYDVVLVASLVIAGFAVGFASLFIVHKQLFSRFGTRLSAVAVAAIILLSSFGIYLGRDLRWSTWSVVTDPAGLTLDVSDRVVHPFAYQHSWDMTGLMFALVGTTYASIWLYAGPKEGRR